MTIQIEAGKEYHLLSIEKVKISKQERKAGKKDYKIALKPVTTVAEVPLNAGNLSLWTVADTNGGFHNIWASQLREIK